VETLLKKIRISIAQINPTVGDLSGNVKKIVSYIKEAQLLRSEIIAFPELAVTGYPPEDLVLKPQFIKDNIKALDEIKKATQDIIAIVGFVDLNNAIFNAAAIISNGILVDVYHKKCLPNYGVFDEFRYFKAGRRYPVYRLGRINFGVNICEDIWEKGGPTRIQAMAGAEVIININASPYHISKISLREDIVRSHASEYGIIMVYVNMVGGQDELIFDGGSFIMNQQGDVVVRCRQFDEDLVTADIEIRDSIKEQKDKKELATIKQKGEVIEKIKISFKPTRHPRPVMEIFKRDKISGIEEVYNALLLGTRDYVHKNGFDKVVIGLSGGIDSALVATIAVDALGKENVKGLFMPSPYTSRESYEDAHALARNLGIEVITVPINSIFQEYLKTLSENFKGTEADITEENLQARIRGNILMAFSNKFGWLVLTTGNKSEMSVGYATLYGDMAGGFAVIKDVQKTMVYELCRWINEKKGREVIPARMFWKEPSAELKPDQRDTDTLPPYPLLDPILKAYVEEDKSFDEIIKMGCDVSCAQKVIRMIDHSEYKRRQAPPGIKITPRAFGKDRRFPITNRYKSY
jgi:NAD+ synthase (glutamine-hydrolysing)